MSFDYAKIQDAASAQINKFGRDCVLKRINKGTFNPANSTFTGGIETSETIKAVFTDIEEKNIDGQTTRRGDKMVLISAKNTAQPVIGDMIDDWKILNVVEVKPADTALIYKAQVRK